MASVVLHIRVPEGLRQTLQRHARARGIRVCEAARDLISRGLGTTPEESGYREGKMAGYHETMKRLAGGES